MIKDKVWIVGADGRLGMALDKLMSSIDYEILRTDIDALDITDIDSVIHFAERNRPDIIINCAGYTSIDKCNENEFETYKVNVSGERNICAAVNMLDAKHVFISTDMVYGCESNKIFNEFDNTNPQNIYAKTKLYGEEYVKTMTNKYFIIRPGWMYGKKRDFINYVLDFSKKNKIINVKKNGFPTPTSPIEVAKLIIDLMETQKYGVYNAVCEGICSSIDFVKKIKEHYNLSIEIKETDNESFDLKKFYPANIVSVNMFSKMSKAYHLKDWECALDEYLQEKEEI